MNDDIDVVERIKYIETLQQIIIQNFNDTNNTNNFAEMEAASRTEAQTTERFFKERDANERRADVLRKARAKRLNNVEKPLTTQHKKRLVAKGGTNAVVVVEETVEETPTPNNNNNDNE